MLTDTTVNLRWLKNPGLIPVGITWGVPWEEGKLDREEPLMLQTEDGKQSFPLQSWATAYWPDGSIKWSAHAASFLDESELNYRVVKGTTSGAAQRVNVQETENTLTLDTGVMAVTLNKRGNTLIRSVVRNGIEICDGSELICLKEHISSVTGVRTVREDVFRCTLQQVIIEQSGPVRAVVKLTGTHRLETGTREWLPFTMRLYVYAGLGTIRLVHTFFYDGNPHEDIIKGLGISFSVPMRGALYNRHIRFAGDSGYFSESPKTLHTRRTKGKYRRLFEQQTQGESVSFQPDEDAYFLRLLDDSAMWDSFKLVQDSSEHYRISKRTMEDCCWLKAVDGKRAGGLAYVGSEGGGLAVGLRNFWQKHPTGFEVQGMSNQRANFSVWFWSPDVPAMDLRHYDMRTHVESSYEGADELRATPYGIANTSELTIWCTEETPRPRLLEQMLDECQSPSLLVCKPEHFHGINAFGLWSLPDRSTPAKAHLEDQLDSIVEFYQVEVEQRKWYGFWDYGDFMHSYDPVRHVWNYDLGGCAWQNTELVPNMWLWVMFLRSGREDLFRLAEAMTRHTSEVDVYHFGEYAGLGSRHNVVHWGCGCKEARIAMAGLHRYYYYLTADERIGDVMDEVKDSDYTTVHLDPMRAYFPKDEHKTHIRVGPDWSAFSSNWMTRWERFEDTAYRDKIITGIQSIKQAKYGLISGPTYGYDPTSGKLSSLGDDNWGRHLAVSMGAPQVWFELAVMLRDPEWEAMMAQFGVYYNLSQEEKDAITDGSVSHHHFEHPILSVAIAAYGAFHLNNQATANRVWVIILENDFARVRLQEDASVVTYIDTLKEIDWINTNEAAQWSLNTIISLELIPESLPQEIMLGGEQHT